MNSVEARKHKTKKSKPHKHHKGGKGSGRGNNTHDSHSPCPAPAPLPNQYASFSVLSFGAKGDGVSDDSKVCDRMRTCMCLHCLSLCVCW